jgi:putative SOS response-associated peptidase YedK
MCGRSSLTKTEKQLEERFNATFYSDELEQYNPLPNFNVAPTHMQPVITSDESNKFHIYRWGLIPSWAADEKVGYNMINARIESLTEKNSFKKLVSSNRCIVPMDGFYEWKTEGKNKQPFRIISTENEVFSVAGLHDSWKTPHGEVIHSYTIITLPSNEFMSQIHDRMPAILSIDGEKSWLETTGETEQLLTILESYPSKKMSMYPVSKKVGNVKEKGKELIDQVPITIQTSLF